MMKNVIIGIFLMMFLGLIGCGESSQAPAAPPTSLPLVNFEGVWSLKLSGNGIMDGACQATSTVTISNGKLTSAGELLAEPTCNNGQVPSQTYEIAGSIDSTGGFSGTVQWGASTYSFDGNCSSATQCSAGISTYEIHIGLGKSK
jgi:hypothetical protein